MKANSILNRILAELASVREVKFATMNLENGAVLEAEAFEAGNEVFVLSGEERVPAPVGEHKLEDGRILVVVEEGLIAEIKEAEGEPAVEVEVEMQSEEAVAVAEEVAAEAVSEVAQEVVAVIEVAVAEAVAPIVEQIQSEMKKMKEELMKYKEEMSAAKQEFSSQAAAKPIKHTPATKQANKVEFNRPMKSIDRVLARLNK
jgi:hypothetical protein